MKSLLQLIHNISLKTIYVLSFLLLVLLSIASFFASYYPEDMISQAMLAHYDNILYQCVYILLILLFIILLLRLPEHKLNALRRLLIYATPIFIMCCGVIWIIVGKTAPAADSSSVFSIAQTFAEGNYTAIQPTGDTYLSYYPQQIGLIAFYELICRLWNLLPFGAPAYHLIKLINVCFATFSVIYGYRIIHILKSSVKADILYLLLSLFNIPLIIYTSFVYGEIPSYSLLIVGYYYLLLADKRMEHGQKSFLPLSASILSLVLAVMLRKNSLIVVIAIVIATSLRYICRKKTVFIAYPLILVIGAFSILPITQKCYELRADNYLLPGVPATSYFAMGMQESSRGNGWYNGYNFYTYQENGLRNDVVSTLSKDEIQKRVDTFASDIPYTIRFYTGKILSQWTDGSYACRQATLQTFSPRDHVIESFYTGDVGCFITQFCNAHQLLIYLGALLYLLTGIKKEEPSWTLLLYIGFISVLGGFLFHIIWEANSRYILPYGFLLIPYAAMGLSELTGLWSSVKTHLPVITK